MTLVPDASVLVAALVDDGPVGQWAEEVLAAHDLAAPHLLPAEVANVLRRAEIARELSPDVVALASADLLELRAELFPFEPFSDRVWELRHNITSYDAWYVALAEHLEAPVATLDGRLGKATGPRCEVLIPPGQ